MAHTLLDILRSTACHCDHGLQFHSRNNWIQNQNSQSSYFHWKPIRRVLLLGRDCEPNFYFFNKMPQKIEIFRNFIKKRFLSSHWQMAFPQGSVVLSQTTRLVKVSKDISYIVLDAAQFPSATSLKSITAHLIKSVKDSWERDEKFKPHYSVANLCTIRHICRWGHLYRLICPLKSDTSSHIEAYLQLVEWIESNLVK